MQNFYFEAKGAPPSFENSSWKGHKRSLNVLQPVGFKSLIPQLSKTMRSSVARLLPTSQKEIFRCFDEDGLETDLLFPVFERNDHAFRVMNMPEPGELEDIPGTDDEMDAAYSRVSTGCQEWPRENPEVTVEVQGQHHEVWDPQENDYYTIKGRITYWKGIFDFSGNDSYLQLDSLSLQLHLHNPSSRGSHVGGFQTPEGSPGIPMGSATSQHHIEAVVAQPKYPKVKLEGQGPNRETGNPPQATKAPKHSLIIRVEPLRYGNENLFANFKMMFPVGVEPFRGSSSSSLSRVFTIKAKAVLKNVMGRIAHVRELESEELDLTISVLKQRELMDGQKGSMVLTESERKRRATLRIY